MNRKNTEDSFDINQDFNIMGRESTQKSLKKQNRNKKKDLNKKYFNENEEEEDDYGYGNERRNRG